MGRIDSDALASSAIDIAKRSEHPVAVEPGRYTVILEPAAVEALVSQIVPGTREMSAWAADHGHTVFGKRGGGNKLGLQMVDARVGLVSDPLDPLAPYSPLTADGAVETRTAWLEQGILRALWYDDTYALAERRAPNLPPGGLRLTVAGAPTTLDEMIASTKRGIWVHRFSNVFPVNERTLLLTGVTRDGTFLIENGTITKPIKNLRVSESPFFVLNRLDAFGAPVRMPGGSVVPRLKVHDFEFTSLTDAV